MCIILTIKFNFKLAMESEVDWKKKKEVYMWMKYRMVLQALVGWKQVWLTNFSFSVKSIDVFVFI